MIVFRNVFWIIILGLATASLIEKRMNYDKYTSKKRFKLEVMLRKVIADKITVKQFITDLPYQIKFDKSYKQYFFSNLLPKYHFEEIDESIECWFNHTTKEENNDNILYLLGILSLLIKFMKNDVEVDEVVFEKYRDEFGNRFSNHTWDIKVFTNPKGIRNFYLYNIKQEEKYNQE